MLSSEVFLKPSSPVVFWDLGPACTACGVPQIPGEGARYTGGWRETQLDETPLHPVIYAEATDSRWMSGPSWSESPGPVSSPKTHLHGCYYSHLQPKKLMRNIRIRTCPTVIPVFFPLQVSEE